MLKMEQPVGGGSAPPLADRRPWPHHPNLGGRPMDRTGGTAGWQSLTEHDDPSPGRAHLGRAARASGPNDTQRVASSSAEAHNNPIGWPLASARLALALSWPRGPCLDRKPRQFRFTQTAHHGATRGRIASRARNAPRHALVAATGVPEFSN